MELTAGSRLKSSVCATEIIIVKAPEGDVDITCGGKPMLAPDQGGGGGTGQEGEISGEAKGGTLLGKRYVNEDETLEVLCTKPGDGSLGIGEAGLAEKETKSLPASD